MPELLRLQDLSYTYSTGTPFEFHALKNVNLTISSGEFVALIGHTGSGKSTLIQHFNGLLKPTAGQVFYRGEDIHADKKRLRELRFHVGLVFQFPEYQLFEETVEKDIAFGPTNMGLSQEEIRIRVQKAADAVGIPEKWLKQSPFELSGGQRRKVAIAGVLAMEPEVLVLDEPTAGLDPRGRDELMGYICAYQQQEDRSVVVISHSMDDVARMAKRIVVMEQGQIMLDGTPGEVFAHGEELAAAGLEIPFAARVMHLVAKRVPDIPLENVYTVEDAAEALLRRKG